MENPNLDVPSPNSPCLDRQGWPMKASLVRPCLPTVSQEIKAKICEEKGKMRSTKGKYQRLDFPCKLPMRMCNLQGKAPKHPTPADFRAASLSAQGKLMADGILAAQASHGVSTNPNKKHHDHMHTPPLNRDTSSQSSSIDKGNSSPSSFISCDSNSTTSCLPEYDFASITANDVTSFTGNPFDVYGSNMTILKDIVTDHTFSWEALRDNDSMDDDCDEEETSKMPHDLISKVTVSLLDFSTVSPKPLHSASHPVTNGPYVDNTPLSPQAPHANSQTNLDDHESPMHPDVFSRLFRESRGIHQTIPLDKPVSKQTDPTLIAPKPYLARQGSLSSSLDCQVATNPPLVSREPLT